MSVDRPVALQIKTTDSKIILTASSPDQKVSQLNVQWHNFAGHDGMIKMILPNGNQAGNSMSVEQEN